MSQVRREEQVVYSNTPGYTQSTYVSQPAGVTTTQTYEYQGVPQYATSGQREGQYVSGQREVVREGTSQYVSGQREVAREGVVREGGYREAGSRAVAAEIPVESRIEYIPFEKKYVEYEQVEKVYQVPVEYEEVEYEEVVRNERVPYERTITDYYAVETQVEYIRREVEETVMVEEPVERTYERVQYIPVETQIVHYPERDNYVAAPTKTRTEYLGIVEGGYEGVMRGGETREVRREENTQNYYAQPVEGRVETRVENRAYERPVETRVESRAYDNRPIETRTEERPVYVSGGNNVNVVTRTSGVNNNASYTTNQGYVPTASTTYVAPSSSTYQSNGYVTGGSGVRQGSGTGYVTGGSGVRASNVNKASYETQAGLKY